MLTTNKMTVLNSFLFFIYFLTISKQGQCAKSRMMGLTHKADIKSFPYAVGMEHNNTFICGGALIHLQYALTAAHCFDDYDTIAKEWKVRAGSEKKLEGGVAADVEAIVLHDHYQPKQLAHLNDIAIVKIKNKLKARSYLKPIDMAASGDEPVEGERASFTGWGKTSDNSFPKIMRVFQLNILKRSECKKLVQSKDLVNSQMICAVPDESPDTQGQAICEQDDGGPLVVGQHLVGIASWSNIVNNKKCNAPSVFTNIEKYRAWIKITTGV